MKRSDLADKIRRQQKALRLGKKWYTEADKLLGEIVCEIFPKDSVSLGDGTRAVLKDNAAEEKTKIGHFVFFRRYEIEMVNG